MLQSKGLCDVHVLVHGDRRLRRVSFCGMCKAWLCDPCRKRLDKRTIAAIIRGASEVVAKLKEVV